MGATGEEMRSRWLEYFDDFLSLREDKETKPSYLWKSGVWKERVMGGEIRVKKLRRLFNMFLNNGKLPETEEYLP